MIIRSTLKSNFRKVRGMERVTIVGKRNGANVEKSYAMSKETASILQEAFDGMPIIKEENTIKRAESFKNTDAEMATLFARGFKAIDLGTIPRNSKGQKHGYFEIYREGKIIGGHYKPGSKKSCGNFLEGAENGLWTYYGEDGKTPTEWIIFNKGEKIISTQDKSKIDEHIKSIYQLDHKNEITF